MRRHLTIITWLAILVVTAPAVAQRNMTVGLFAGVGGSFDAEPDPGLSQPSLQISLAVPMDDEADLVLRVGALDLDDDQGFGGLRDAALQYATVAGEYKFQEPFYVSGIFLGLGAYRLDGEPFDAREDDEGTALGLTLGVSGDFVLARRWSLLAELSGHWVDFDRAQVFGLAHLGIGYRF